LLIGIAASVIVAAAAFQWNLFASSTWVADFPRWQVRPILVLFECGACLFALAALRLVHLPKPAETSVVMATLAFVLPLTASIDANVAAHNRHRRDYDPQMALRQASLTLESLVSNNDIVLVQWTGVEKSHLYVMYWSGRESFEVTKDRSIETRIASLPRDRRVFLLRDSSSRPGADRELSPPSFLLTRVR